MKKTGMVFLVLILACLEASAANFNVMTWNVYMLPKPIKFSNQNARIGLMIEELSKLDHDMIVLQEAFSSPFRTQLKLQLSEKWPYQTVLGKSGRFSKVMNSGVYILSRKPFKIVGSEYYLTCASADCFSSKGIIIVKTKVDQGFIQIGVTHMQSGQKKGIDLIRFAQLLQIKRLMDVNREPGVPQILMGDLNIDALTGSEFGNALSLLGMTNTALTGELRTSKSQLTNCMGQANSNKQEWLDHMLVRANDSTLVTIDKKVRLIQDYVKGVWCDLSDHYPVEGTFAFQAI